MSCVLIWKPYTKWTSGCGLHVPGDGKLMSYNGQLFCPWLVLTKSSPVLQAGVDMWPRVFIHLSHCDWFNVGMWLKLSQSWSSLGLRLESWGKERFPVLEVEGWANGELLDGEPPEGSQMPLFYLGSSTQGPFQSDSFNIQQGAVIDWLTERMQFFHEHLWILQNPL